jgi:Leucine-rich repeat (LRR) protein
VTKVLLDATGLDLVDPSSNINALWGVLGSELLELDLSGNRYLGLLDLTPLTGLTTLTLSGFNQPQGAVTPPLPTSVTLPSPFSALTFLDVHSSGLMVDLSRTPQLKELHAAGNYAPWNLADIWKAPALQIVDFVASAVSTSTAVGSLSGAALTKDVLSRLGSTNPALETLLLSSTTHLDFGDAAADTLYGSNVPVVKSPSLRTLGLSQLSQLSALKGIDPMLLAYLPALEELLLSGAPNVCINISSVAPNAASSSISTLQFAGTCLRGDLSVLSSSRFSKLSVLSADDSGLGGSLPPNVAAVWPELKTLSLARNGLEGSMTSFADLPNLAFLKLTSNKITGRLPTNFLENSLGQHRGHITDEDKARPGESTIVFQLPFAR